MTKIITPTLTDEEMAALRGAPHTTFAAMNAAAGLGLHIVNLIRWGYLEETERHIGRDPHGLDTRSVYDLTEKGAEAVGRNVSGSKTPN